MDVFEQLQEEYEKDKKIHIATDDVALALLAAKPNTPIQNRVVIMKEMFLTYKELIDKEIDKQHVEVVDPEFFAHDYGAFSYKIAETISLLVSNGYVERMGRKGNEQFSLTKMGKKAFKLTMTSEKGKYLKGVFNKLKTKRKGWDISSRQGLINLTYNMYPKYKENSKLKNRYQATPWAELFKE